MFHRLVPANLFFDNVNALHQDDIITGSAMKADEANVKFGSIIGKALADLESGTGTMPVMVTLK